jgi:hypothetical protein
MPYWRRIETASPINDFALNRLARRCLCNTLGCTLRDWAAYCCETRGEPAKRVPEAGLKRANRRHRLIQLPGCGCVMRHNKPDYQRIGGRYVAAGDC